MVLLGRHTLTAAAAEGAEVRILADLGREFALDDRRGAGAAVAVAGDGDGRVLSAVLRRGAPAKISSMHASTQVPRSKSTPKNDAA